MKILIISLPRTGSSNFLFKIAEEKKLKPIFEPFHDGTNQYKNWIYNPEEDNVVVKTIVHHHIDNLEIAKQFDEIILLSRKNLKECAESYAFFNNNIFGSFTSYQPYYYENVTDSQFNYAYKSIKKYDSELKKLSKILNIPIIYYENIYDVNDSERLRKYERKNVIKNKLL